MGSLLTTTPPLIRSHPAIIVRRKMETRAMRSPRRSTASRPRIRKLLALDSIFGFNLTLRRRRRRSSYGSASCGRLLLADIAGRGARLVLHQLETYGRTWSQGSVSLARDGGEAEEHLV